MSDSTPYARIAITLPERDLAAADRLALAQDRSRSWIVAEAIRTYAAEQAQRHQVEFSAPPGELALSQRPGLGPSRLAQLERDLSLTPEERVRTADETLRLTESPNQARRHRLIAFDNYEDFLDWKFLRSLRR